MTMEPEVEEWRKAWSSVDAGEGENKCQGSHRCCRAIPAPFSVHSHGKHRICGPVAGSKPCYCQGGFIATRWYCGPLCLDDNLARRFSCCGRRKARVENIEKVADYVALHRRLALADRWKARTGLAFSLFRF